MSTTSSGRPDPAEYGPYYERYVSLVPGDDIIPTLGRQLSDTLALWRAISEEKAATRYAPDKWTLREVAGHVLDFERIFAYRALLIARGDGTPLPG
ncbi:MAG: DinB family protein, partial [Pyrinomonadaceae bacterium]